MLKGNRDSGEMIEAVEETIRTPHDTGENLYRWLRNPITIVRRGDVMTEDSHKFSKEEDDTPLARLPTDFAFSTKSTAPVQLSTHVRVRSRSRTFTLRQTRTYQLPPVRLTL